MSIHILDSWMILHMEDIGWSVEDSGVRKTAEEAKYVLDVDGCQWTCKTIIKSKNTSIFRINQCHIITLYDLYRNSIEPTQLNQKCGLKQQDGMGEH